MANRPTSQLIANELANRGNKEYFGQLSLPIEVVTSLKNAQHRPKLHHGLASGRAVQVHDFRLSE